MNKCPELLYLSGERAGETIPLEGEEITIGRSRSNTVVIDDPLVSRQHLRITVKGNTVVAHDTGSSHGTFLNNKRIRGSVSLTPGDVLQLGDIQLRFSAPIDSAEEEKTSFIDADGQEVSQESRATQFADVSGGGSETGFAPIGVEAPAEESMDKTRVFEEGETRILDQSELRGLRPGGRPETPKKRLALGVALVVLVILAAGVLVVRQNSGTISSATESSSAVCTDKQYGFSIEHPPGWKRTQGSPETVYSFEHKLRGAAILPGMKIHADMNTVYGTTGLQAGFEEYKNILKTRHPGMKPDGSKVTRINNVTAVFYGFTAAEKRGKGLYILSGDRQICVECCAALADYPAFTKEFSSMLQGFRLSEAQQFIDFALPSQATRNLALSDPAKLTGMAKHQLEIGEDLLKNSTVRPANLYMAVLTLKECLTMASALGERPSFQVSAAQNLLAAQQNLENGIRDQKFQIAVAERRGDREKAYWESVKLIQMVPDKTSEPYQYAARRIKLYAERKRK